jgi:hypothetical protein
LKPSFFKKQRMADETVTYVTAFHTLCHYYSVYFTLISTSLISTCCLLGLPANNSSVPLALPCGLSMLPAFLREEGDRKKSDRETEPPKRMVLAWRLHFYPFG